MVGIPLPGESQLPPGATRQLVVYLHELYAAAGKPSLREISVWIRDQHDLPGTLSHQGVSDALQGRTVPRWSNLESLVRVFAQNRRIGDSDVEASVARVHGLWLAASSLPVELTSARPEEPTRREESRGETIELGLPDRVAPPTSRQELLTLLSWAYVVSGATMTDIAERIGVRRSEVVAVIGIGPRYFPSHELFMDIVRDLVDSRHHANWSVAWRNVGGPR